MTAYSDPLGRRFLAAAPRRAPLMPLWHRWGASSAGTRDGRLGLPELPPAGATTFDTFWISRNRRSFAEADHRSLLRLEARVAPTARELASVVATRDGLVADRDEASATLRMLRERTRPDIASIQRGPGEKTATDSVVLSRRQRDWNAPVSAVASRISDLDKRIAELDKNAAELAALLSTVFGGALTRSSELRAFYQRRADVYARALTRAHASGPQLASLVVSTAIQAPDWTTGDCPWIPTSYNREVQN